MRRQTSILAMMPLLVIVGCQRGGAACTRQTPMQAYCAAEIVFEGTVREIGSPVTTGAWPAGNVKFSVGRVWKGNVASDFEMPTVVVQSGGLGFYAHLLKPGVHLLVYARRASWTPTGEKAFFTYPCAGTRPIEGAADDILVLDSIKRSGRADCERVFSHERQ